MNGALKIQHWKLPVPPDSNTTPGGMVDLMGNPADYHAVLLASMGFTFRAISEQTGLSEGQIQYRISKLNKRLPENEKLNSYNYRNARSKTSKAVVDAASRKVAQVINAPMRRALAKTDAIDV